jgi:hypothetical protein
MAQEGPKNKLYAFMLEKRTPKKYMTKTISDDWAKDS